jgi:hypothetical protein
MVREGRPRRRVRRVVREVEYVNTINVRDRVTIDFVWYPGAPIVSTSRVDTAVANHPTTGRPRRITYTWTRDGRAPVTRPISGGRITIPLPPGSRGILRAFGTTWEIRRAARDEHMAAVNTLRGVQQRLNRLGYHLRRPGAANPGTDNILGRRTELAVLQFQNDYTPPVGAPAAASNQLKIRGEWVSNTHATFQGNLNRYNGAACPNPTAADSSRLRASIRARVGG